jgi:hypothetical protein
VTGILKDKAAVHSIIVIQAECKDMGKLKLFAVVHDGISPLAARLLPMEE